MALGLTARKSQGSFIVGGINIIAAASSNSVVSFTWQDNTQDMADGVTVEIADPQRTWMLNYLPKKGIESTASITVMDWNNPGDMRILECGIFWIDQIDCSGPPNVVSVKGTSIPITMGIKTQKKFKAWEDTDMMTVGSELAANNGLAFVWDSKEMPKKEKRIDQSEAPDLEFLRDKYKELGLSMKIYKRQLVIYSEEEYEARGPAFTIMYGASNILGYAISSKLDDTYKGAKNTYVDPATGDLVEAFFNPSKPPEGSGSELDENHYEESEDDGGGGGGELFDAADDAISAAAAKQGSEKKIKSKLREKNKHEKTATFTLIGDPTYLSGLNLELVGFGSYDGKWFIYGTVHTAGPGGYTTQLSLRYCLEGY